MRLTGSPPARENRLGKGLARATRRRLALRLEHVVEAGLRPACDCGRGACRTCRRPGRACRATLGAGSTPARGAGAGPCRAANLGISPSISRGACSGIGRAHDQGDLVRETQPVVGTPPQGDLSAVGLEEGGIADQAGGGRRRGRRPARIPDAAFHGQAREDRRLPPGLDPASSTCAASASPSSGTRGSTTSASAHSSRRPPPDRRPRSAGGSTS